MLLCVAEFINTKDPESDDASSIKEQNERVNETKKNKTGNKCESPVNGPERVNETKKNKTGNTCESPVNGPGMNSP